MAFPTMTLNRVRGGELADATPGSLVGILWDRRMRTGVALGEPGVAASHLLVDEDGIPTVYAFAAIGNPHVLLVDMNGQMLLDIPTTEFDTNRLSQRVGQLALTKDGPMVCASAGTDGFRRHVPQFVCPTSFRLIANSDDLHRETEWVAQWALTFRDSAEGPSRFIGNPPWPAVARLPG